ncbi:MULTISPECIES: type I CRISPR-associated protein Cas7 [unclassified Clostridium]|uniref:type I CRISPR-associated protein Cas7 n=1 Tax=unclassified Clostridium TaxID=2614128 RepID=UPI00207A61B9|nr:MULTISPECIES: type I CRISPR-associated protein Cas7 [unclassified Clostridium]
MKMNNNIYGVLGIEAVNSNWNADFDGMPKTDNGENIKGSPYAIQYCIKKLWQSKGEKVLGLKETDEKSGKIFTLEGKLNSISETKIEKEKEVWENLLRCKDVRNFGVVFAVKKLNGGLCGVVQIQDGLNKFKDTQVKVETILSPYVNSNKTDNNATTNGTRITTDEAHYVYPFSVNPNQLDSYTEEDYQDFKDVSLKSVTLYNSKAKAGCKNEFGLFVRVKEECNYVLALGDLSEYILVYKEEDKIVYNLTKLNQLLEDCKDKIEDVEMYYNPYLLKVIGLDATLDIVKFNIISGKEL